MKLSDSTPSVPSEQREKMIRDERCQLRLLESKLELLRASRSGDEGRAAQDPVLIPDLVASAS